MLVGQAKDLARKWVIEEGTKIPGFSGAFIAGSITLLQDDDVLAPSSDVDLFLIVSDPPPIKIGKFIYQNVLLEGSYVSEDQFQAADLMLGSEVASSFKAAIILSDSSGRLSKLQAQVSKDCAKRKWVRKRCEVARGSVLATLNALNASEPFHDQVNYWLGGAWQTANVLLMAGLKMPTVRKKYLATRELLAEYNRLDFYEDLLEMAGFGWMSRTDVERHLAEVTEVFDVVKTIKKTPYRFASDVSDVGRAIAIDGSREFIERGYHQEAMFYLVRTYCRCQHVLLYDAPLEIRDRYDAIFRGLLGDFGIVSFADLQLRFDQAREFLPRVWEVAEDIMVANLGIED